MNWTRVILDGIALCIVFNAVAALFAFLLPQAYSTMFPKEIKEAAAPYVVKKDLTKMYWIHGSLFVFLLVYMVCSTLSSGVTGFWNLFWTGYVEMFFVNVGDFLILDCWLRGIGKDMGLVKGAENCKAWEFREWMKMAVPEHAAGWPLIFCPLAGLVLAGIGALV